MFSVDHPEAPVPQVCHKRHSYTFVNLLNKDVFVHDQLLRKAKSSACLKTFQRVKYYGLYLATYPHYFENYCMT